MIHELPLGSTRLHGYFSRDISPVRSWPSIPATPFASRRRALASVAVDLRVTQIVNRVSGVHAVLRDDALG